MWPMLTPPRGIARQIQPARNQEHCCVLAASVHAVHDRHDSRGNPDKTWNHVVIVFARPADFAAGVLLALSRWLFARSAWFAICGHCVCPVCCVVIPRRPQAFRRNCTGSSVGSCQSVHIANSIASPAACIRACCLVSNTFIKPPDKKTSHDPFFL